MWKHFQFKIDNIVPEDTLGEMGVRQEWKDANVTFATWRFC
jgi:hypothetical protein